MAQVCSKYFLLFSLYNLLFARLTVTECSTTSAPACAATLCAVTSSPAVSTSRQSTSSSTSTSPRWLRHTCTGSAAAEGEQSSRLHCYEHISWEVKHPMFSTLESVCQITSLHLRSLEKWFLWSFINFETFVRENLNCSFHFRGWILMPIFCFQVRPPWCRHQPDHLRWQIRPPQNRARAGHGDQTHPQGHRQVPLRGRVPPRGGAGVTCSGEHFKFQLFMGLL